MIAKPPGAIELTAAGQEYVSSCRIIGVLWKGSSTAGDEVMIKGRGENQNRVFWPARTDTTNTYLGAIWGPPGLHAPDGFRAEVLMSGTVYVYLAE
jgi:hypothetical protein